MFDPEPLRGLADDGLHLPEIKAHSLEKYRAHNHNVSIFATAMKSMWPQRAYIGLYSGAGRARLENSGEIVETTATAVFRLPDPFTHHIFVDQDEECTRALRQRIKALPGDFTPVILTGDVNSLVPEIHAALPPYGASRGLLSYCFVDPFAANLKFATIRELGRLRMDFLIVLMLGWDARVNFKVYLEDESNTRIAELIDAPNWREEWRREFAGRRSRVVPFLMRKFDEAMVRIGYQSASSQDALSVKVHNKGVLIYQLVFYSKHPLGKEFWGKTRVGVKPQMELPLYVSRARGRGGPRRPRM